MTYSLPNPSYVHMVFRKRPRGIKIICHEKFQSVASMVKTEFPDIKIRTHPQVHAKFCLIEPGTVHLGSANFGRSGWMENMIGIRSEEVFEYILETQFKPLWT